MPRRPGCGGTLPPSQPPCRGAVRPVFGLAVLPTTAASRSRSAFSGRIPASASLGRAMMLVSVVIPVYNGARTVGPLVRRLLDVLHGRRLQVVLVNDGSPDDSDPVCREI